MASDWHLLGGEPLMLLESRSKSVSSLWFFQGVPSLSRIPAYLLLNGLGYMSWMSTQKLPGKTTLLILT